MALDFFAGCVGGCAGLLVGHPFDTIKVRLQTDSAKKPRYRSATHCFVTTIKTESFSGLYKGISSPMVGIAFINAILFGTYGSIQRQFEDQESLSTFFLAGGLAGCIQAFVASPMELVKTRIQIQGQGSSSYSTLIGKKQPTLYKGPMDCVKKIYMAEGLRGVFRGQCVTLLREFTGIGLYFASYEYLTQRFFTDPNEKNSVLSTGELLLAGGLAGVISWTPTYPIDMVKSRFQVDGCEGPRLYKGAMDCAMKSYKMEGMKAFTRGMAPTILRAYPTNAVTFTVVAWIMRLSGVEIPTEMDDKQEALAPSVSPAALEQQPVKESGFLIKLKGIGAITLSREINRLAMCSLPREDGFLKEMKAASNVTFLYEELSKSYGDKMVPMALPMEIADVVIQEETQLEDEKRSLTLEASAALTDLVSSNEKAPARKLSISEVFHLDLNSQDCELDGSSLTPEQAEFLSSKSRTRRLSVNELFYIDLSLQDCELTGSASLSTEKNEVLTPQRSTGKNLPHFLAKDNTAHPTASNELHLLINTASSDEVKQATISQVNVPNQIYGPSEATTTSQTLLANLKSGVQESNSSTLEDSEVAPCSPTCTNNTRCCTYSMDFIEQETQKASAFSRRLIRGMVRQLKVGLFDMPINYDI